MSSFVIETVLNQVTNINKYEYIGLRILTNVLELEFESSQLFRKISKIYSMKLK
jgi:hypothetical protein